DRKSFARQGALIHEKIFDGVLLAPSFIEESVEFVKICQSRNIPFVYIDSNLQENSSLSYIGPPLFQSGYLGAKLCTFGIQNSKKVMIVNIAKEICNFNYSQIEEGFKKYYQDQGNLNDIVKVNIDQT